MNNAAWKAVQKSHHLQLNQQQHNKALHPTAYSFARSSLRFRRRVSLVVLSLRAALMRARSNRIMRYMELPLPTKNEAAEQFIERMVYEYQSVVQNVMGSLRNPVKSSDENYRRRSEWFKSLNEQQREQVEDVVRDAVHFALFQACVLLDGSQGGGDGGFNFNLPEIQNGEFALYLKGYADHERYKRDEAIASIRITGSGSGDDLHDLFGQAADASNARK